MTTEQRRLEVFVLSYVPPFVAKEKYDVGVLVLERKGDRTCFADARFIADTKELLALDPSADVNMLLAFFREVEQRLRDLEEADAFLQTMLDSFSNTIKISDSRTVVISGDPARVVDKLAALYVRH